MNKDLLPLPCLIENKLWIISHHIGMGLYDFSFENFFACKHPYILPEGLTAIARMGAAPDYSDRYNHYVTSGIQLIHTPEEYALTSYLPQWYPKIKQYTPKSIVYEKLPSVKEVEKHFHWPIFVKGERQTHKHNKKTSVIENSKEFEQLLTVWEKDPILHWQKMVCREYIPLEKVVDTHKDLLPKSYEFRTFWWNNECVAIGEYWASESYPIQPHEEREIKRIGTEITNILNVAFLVIDFALTEKGKWIVIEVNDGQDSGYGAINPLKLWRNVLDLV